MIKIVSEQFSKIEEKIAGICKISTRLENILQIAQAKNRPMKRIPYKNMSKNRSSLPEQPASLSQDVA